MSTVDRGHPDLGTTRTQIADAVRRARPWAYVAVDLGAPVVIAVLWMLLPFDASLTDRLIGLVGLLLLAPLDLLLRRTVDPRWSNYAVMVSRSMVVVVIPAFVPPVWVPAALGLGITTVAAVPIESRRRIASLVAVNAVGLAVTGVIADVSYWYLSVIVIVVVSLFCDAFYREWHAERSEVERRHDEMLDRAQMFSWEVDRDTMVIRSVVGDVEGVLGYRPDELVGRPVEMVIDRHDPPAERPTEAGGRRDPSGVIRARRKDGGAVVLRDTVLDDTGAVLRGVAVDMTELSEVSEALRHQAEHDALTGLANRVIVERTITRALEREADSVAIAIADLDRFKDINDTLGHPTGDRVLQALADRFADGLDDVDLIARLGGDEFAFVVLDATDVGAVAAIGRRIHAMACSPVGVDDLELAVSCSVGIAVAPDHGTDFADLMKHADIATYAAKRSGGGVRLFEEAPGELSVRRLRLTSEVGGAIDRGEFELHFQPQVDLDTGHIVGAEGLARWRHPEYGLLQPGAFLDAIDVAAASHRFTDEVIRQAVELVAAAADDGHVLDVAVNLNSLNFLDRGLPTRIANLLRRYDVAGPRLTLELTESDLLDEQQGDLPVFEAVRRLGVRLSIDDFGTGHSTLTRLRALDVGEVKIDRAFVGGIEAIADDAIIVRSVIELCGHLGHAVVAEGVETLGQLERLQDYGCRVAQGFYFAEPMPRSDFLERLASGEPYSVGCPVRSVAARGS